MLLEAEGAFCLTGADIQAAVILEKKSNFNKATLSTEMIRSQWESERCHDHTQGHECYTKVFSITTDGTRGTGGHAATLHVALTSDVGGCPGSEKG